MKNVNLILHSYVMFIIYNFVLNFFFEFFLIYTLEGFIILSNIISIIRKFRGVFGDWLSLINWLNLLFHYFIIIGNTEYSSDFQFEIFSVQKEVLNNVVSILWEKDFGSESYLLVCFVSEVSDGKDNLSFRE